MRFATPPSQERIDAFQKKLKLVFAILAFLGAFIVLSQASLELWARRGFEGVPGIVDSIIRWNATSTDSAVHDFFYQDVGALTQYRYTIASTTYTGQDIVSSNRLPTKRTVAAPAVAKGQVRTILVSRSNFAISRFPRPVAYPLFVGLALLAVGLFLVCMRNDKTPHYYDSRAYTQN